MAHGSQGVSVCCSIALPRLKTDFHSQFLSLRCVDLVLEEQKGAEKERKPEFLPQACQATLQISGHEW